MKDRFARAAAEWVCDVLIRLSPRRLSPWAEGLRSEVTELGDDWEALRFAISGAAGVLPQILLEHVRIVTGIGLRGAEPAPGAWRQLSMNPRKTGVLCAAVSVLFGVLYLVRGEAPLHYPVFNLTALVVGLAGLALLQRVEARSKAPPGLVIAFLAAAVLLTAFFGTSAEGVSRWISVGPATFQTSLVVLPAAVVVFARSRSSLSAAGIAVLGLALAVQPDPAMAFALCAGLAVIALCQVDRAVSAALGFAGVAAWATLGKPEALSPVAFVEGVYADALSAGPLAALIVGTGVAALFGPAIALLAARGRERAALLAFLAVWSAIMLAAATGKFQTPFVGYGPSSIIGYLLSLAALPARLSGSPAGTFGAKDLSDGSGNSRSSRKAFVCTPAVKIPNRSSRWIRLKLQSQPTR
jgi:hypothetical protein